MTSETGSKPAYAIIVAAGSGRRCPGPQSKQFMELCGLPLYLWSVKTFQESPEISGIIIVGPQHHDQALIEMQEKTAVFDKVIKVVAGGESRTESLNKGVTALSKTRSQLRDSNPILIHDGVRPLVSRKLIAKVAKQVNLRQVAIPTTTPTATVKKIVGTQIRETLPRDQLGLAQTPQGVPYGLLCEALEHWCRNPATPITDEGALIENLPPDKRNGVTFFNVKGESENLKVTFPEDLRQAESILHRKKASPQKNTDQDPFKPRQATGFGYDVHAFASARKLILGGVEIPGHPGLAGHSDADVLIHALVDALLGAVGAGDIGQHFPDNDPIFKNCSSLHFLIQTLGVVKEKGFQLGAADITIVAEQPKLAPHIPAMLKLLKETITLPCQLNIKATTSEGLGFTGRREGIAAYAVATVFAK